MMRHIYYNMGAKRCDHTYGIGQGHSLEEVAQRSYGVSQAWRLIYEANHNQMLALYPIETRLRVVFL